MEIHLLRLVKGLGGGMSRGLAINKASEIYVIFNWDNQLSDKAGEIYHSTR